MSAGAMLLRKAWAFFQRDLLTESSYKFGFLLDVVIAVAPVLTFFFIGKMIPANSTESLRQYGGAYFPFAMVGVALSQYFALSLNAFANAIRRTQMAGCLEATLSTRTRPQTVIVFSALYSFAMKSVHMVIIFVVSGLLLGVSYRNMDAASLVLAMLLTVVAFSGFGILSAAIILILKRGDPIEWVMGTLFSLLGGAFFPIEVMPQWLQNIAAFLPITHALHATRLAVLQGHTPLMLWKDFLILLVMACILIPMSMAIFALSVEKGRRDGSLMHY